MTNGTDSKYSTFLFRKHDSIGAAAAEEDDFLADCFVDVGDIDALKDCRNGKRVIVGRTGAGKSALLRILATKCNRVVELSPHGLSINYIANNAVIRFFEEAGVNLTAFYMLLWKHVLVVELLKEKYQIRTEDGAKATMRRLRDILYRKDHLKEQAVEYLENWGNKFWITSDERIRELTERVERNLTGSLRGLFGGITLSADAAKTLSTEQKTEVIQRGQQAVSQVQIRELENIIRLLDEDVFSDDQDHFYVTVDTLDEEWADDRIRFRLIKALIDTVRNFKRVRNVKIIVALRQDLLEKILSSTSDPGFQEEKYESLYLHLNWSEKSLSALLEQRVNCLIRRRYTTRPVELRDVLPNNIDGQSSIDYILDRTFRRPRDVILFFNECLSNAEGRAQLSAAVIKQAELPYSRKRLQSLAYEWRLIYPNLTALAQMLHGMPARFPLSALDKDFVAERFQLALTQASILPGDPNTDALHALYTPNGNFQSARSLFVRNLHRVGMIGIKTDPTSSTTWIADARSSLGPGELKPSSIIQIHPMFYRALGTRL